MDWPNPTVPYGLTGNINYFFRMYTDANPYDPPDLGGGKTGWGGYDKPLRSWGPYPAQRLAAAKRYAAGCIKVRGCYM